MKKILGMIMVLLLGLSIVACKKETPADVTVTVAPTSVSVEIGKTATVVATVSDTSVAVTWASADESVATVASGTITGLKEGTTTVTATAGKATANVAVTVTKAPVAPTVTVETIKAAVQAILGKYEAATEASFKLRAIGDKTQTSEVAYHISANAITDFAYVLSGSTKASLYVKDGKVYIYNINGDTNKSMMAMTSDEATKIASTYAFSGITATSLAWAYEDAFWAALTLGANDAESADLTLDLTKYAGTAITTSDKTSAILSINYDADGAITLISIAFVTSAGANTSISLWLNGLANVTIEFPDLTEYN